MIVTSFAEKFPTVLNSITEGSQKNRIEKILSRSGIQEEATLRIIARYYSKSELTAFLRDDCNMTEDDDADLLATCVLNISKSLLINIDRLSLLRHYFQTKWTAGEFLDGSGDC